MISPILAESEGLEPTIHFWTTVFKTAWLPIITTLRIYLLITLLLYITSCFMSTVFVLISKLTFLEWYGRRGLNTRPHWSKPCVLSTWTTPLYRLLPPQGGMVIHATPLTNAVLYCGKVNRAVQTKIRRNQTMQKSEQKLSIEWLCVSKFRNILYYLSSFQSLSK